MKQSNFFNQLRNNAIALISLVIALMALVLNTWRLEQTERNRNIRQAGFEILKTLGQLQAVINNNLYSVEPSKIDPIQGWSFIAMMNDLVVLMPEPVPEDLTQLTDVWSVYWKNLTNNEANADIVSRQIDFTREAVLKALNELH